MSDDGTASGVRGHVAIIAGLVASGWLIWQVEAWLHPAAPLPAAAAAAPRLAAAPLPAAITLDLGQTPSPSAAADLWDSARANAPDAIGLSARMRDTGAAVALELGPVGSLGQAKTICDRLNYNNIACTVKSQPITAGAS